MIQTQPANPAFQFPPKRSPRTTGSSHNGINTRRTELNPIIVGSRTFLDIQITDLHLYQKRHLHRRLRRFRLIHHLAVSIEHLISRILICTLLRIGKNLVSALLTLTIRPCLPDTVPLDRLAARILRVIRRQLPLLDIH